MTTTQEQKGGVQRGVELKKSWVFVEETNEIIINTEEIKHKNNLKRGCKRDKAALRPATLGQDSPSGCRAVRHP
jgi:hypothetical protein